MRSKVVKILGYFFFFLMAFIFFLYYTFPFYLLKDQIRSNLYENFHINVETGSIEPSMLTGLVFKNVKVIPPSQSDASQFTIDELRVRISLLSMFKKKINVKFFSKLFGGKIEGVFSSQQKQNSLQTKIEGINLRQITPINQMFGIQTAGDINGKIALDFHTKDLTKMSGKILLALKSGRFTILGKRAINIPTVQIGELKSVFSIEKGRIKVDKFVTNNSDIEAKVEGFVVLNQELEKSAASLTLRFKPVKKFLDANPKLVSLLQVLNLKKGSGPGNFYNYSMSGTITSPLLRPLP